MCRHTVGLNWTSIGIEHVGTSDREILANPRQLHASLRLTAWLRCHDHVAIGRRDRSQREPPLPVPSRASPGAAQPHTRRLDPQGHGSLPHDAPPISLRLTRSERLLLIASATPAAGHQRMVGRADRSELLSAHSVSQSPAGSAHGSDKRSKWQQPGCESRL
jgi:hypothetical protein